VRIADRGSSVADVGETAVAARKPNLNEKKGDSVPRPNVLNSPVYPGLSKMILYVAAALSLFAALIHLWVMPEHFEEWWGYGTFFLAAAMAQGLYGLALLRWSWQPLLLLGIGGNLVLIVLYGITRTVGISFFGPHAGEVEAVGVADLFATTSELALVVALLGVLLRGLPRERVVVALFVLALVGLLVGHLLHLMLSLTPAH
jgi:hypothetical protein